MTGLFNTLRNYGFLIVLGATYVFFSVAAPSFFGIGNLVDILHVVAPMIVVAGGMALVVMSGKLDISVGSTAYVASSIFALLMREGSVPFPVGVAAAIGAGLVLGAINGLIVVGLRVNSLIATLGTMIAFRGFGLMLTDGGLIEMPNAIKPLGNTLLGPLYLDTAIALIILVVIHLVHRRTTFGRQLTAIGNNEDVARRIGIPIAQRTFATLVLSGALAALGGVMYTLQVAVNTAKIGEGMEFTAVAAVVVGGISLFGGRGNILWAVILGSLMFQIIRSGLQHIGANPYSYRLVEGVVIFIAMYADALKVGRAGNLRARIQKKT
jgi:ribose/xylose/arabinose/galactoside ABC-type transport system permease subunit